MHSSIAGSNSKVTARVDCRLKLPAQRFGDQRTVSSTVTRDFGNAGQPTGNAGPPTSSAVSGNSASRAMSYHRIPPRTTAYTQQFSKQKT